MAESYSALAQSMVFYLDWNGGDHYALPLARETLRVGYPKFYGTSASPHGDAPTGMRATTSSVSVSSTVTSFEGPFAV